MMKRVGWIVVIRIGMNWLDIYIVRDDQFWLPLGPYPTRYLRGPESLGTENITNIPELPDALNRRPYIARQGDRTVFTTFQVGFLGFGISQAKRSPPFQVPLPRGRVLFSDAHVSTFLDYLQPDES